MDDNGCDRFQAAVRAIATSANLTHSRGIALIAGLMLMASMVLLALAVATGMLLERRMAGNFGDSQLGLQRAQLAGRWADYWLQSRPHNPLDPGCSADCGPSPPIFESRQLPHAPEFEDSAWWQLHGESAGVDPGSGEVRMDYTLAGTEAPRWVIEELRLEPLQGIVAEPGEPEPTLGYYRILARGSGRYPGSVAVTETIIARPWAAEFMSAPYPPDPAGPWFCEQVPQDIPCGRQAWRRRR